MVVVVVDQLEVGAFAGKYCVCGIFLLPLAKLAVSVS